MSSRALCIALSPLPKLTGDDFGLRLVENLSSAHSRRNITHLPDPFADYAHPADLIAAKSSINLGEHFDALWEEFVTFLHGTYRKVVETHDAVVLEGFGFDIMQRIALLAASDQEWKVFLERHKERVSKHIIGSGFSPPVYAVADDTLPGFRLSHWRHRFPSISADELNARLCRLAAMSAAYFCEDSGQTRLLLDLAGDEQDHLIAILNGVSLNGSSIAA